MEMYAVRNQEGKYFKNKGYGGYGKQWKDTLEEARIYTKRQGATAQCTYWGKHFPDYGVPEIVVLEVKETGTIDQTDRVLKVLRKQIVDREKWTTKRLKGDIKEAEQKLKQLQEKL
jgi:hypothetical protein